VLAERWPDARWVFLDSNARRTAFLETAVGELGLTDRVRVVTDRAERAARVEEFRGAFDLVVSRSFGPPAVTAECACGFLAVGGRLVVSEPPDDAGERWPDGPLGDLGLADRGRMGAVRLLEQLTLSSARFPRRTGVPAKRPLW
jgi:16S rRNA (guanine527-N7)-methyltransferase